MEKVEEKRNNGRYKERDIKNILEKRLRSKEKEEEHLVEISVRALLTVELSVPSDWLERVSGPLLRSHNGTPCRISYNMSCRILYRKPLSPCFAVDNFESLRFALSIWKVENLGSVI